MKFNISQDMKSGQWVVTKIKDRTKVKFSNYMSAHNYVVNEIIGDRLKPSYREHISV